MRRALGSSDWVLYTDRRYSLNTARGYDCDLATFELALAEARKARGGDALPALQRALAAYGGDFLAGLAAAEWAAARRDELRRSFESALLATGRLHAAADRHQAAATAFRRAVAHEPLNETAHRELMQSWASLGETARAVATTKNSPTSSLGSWACRHRPRPPRCTSGCSAGPEPGAAPPPRVSPLATPIPQRRLPA